MYFTAMLYFTVCSIPIYFNTVNEKEMTRGKIIFHLKKVIIFVSMSIFQGLWDKINRIIYQIRNQIADADFLLPLLFSCSYYLFDGGTFFVKGGRYTVSNFSSFFPNGFIEMKEVMFFNLEHIFCCREKHDITI